jgi:hypothetical protein
MQENGQARDFGSYLRQPGSADVFFPTNFAAAKVLWSLAKGSNRQMLTLQADHMPNRTFMTLYAEIARTKTMTTYNPLLDDFDNTSFLLADAS